MAQVTLTAVQQKMLEPLIDKAIEEQSAVAIYQNNLTAGEARRDAKYGEVQDSLADLGHAPPDPVTSITKQVDEEGAWTGVVVLNE
jgi:hypothetical protein